MVAGVEDAGELERQELAAYAAFDKVHQQQAVLGKTNIHAGRRIQRGGTTLCTEHAVGYVHDIDMAAINTPRLPTSAS